MQHATLVLSLEKAALQSIKTQLLLLQKKQPVDTRHDFGTITSGKGTISADVDAESDLYDNDLNAVKFEHFALTLLNHMNNMVRAGERKYIGNQLYTQTTSFYLQMASIISVFDSVDVDSRGVIAFNDFVDFCLRLGRLLLKPSIKSSFSTYLQYEGAKGSLFPSHKLRYFPTLNALFVMDTETPRVRVYRKDGRFLARINPVSEAKRHLHHQGIQKTTYYEKANYEKEFNNMKATERDFDEGKGQILDCCYVDSLKQVVFSSTHSYLFFMDASIGFKENAMNNSKRDDCYHVQHFVKTKYPQYGLYYCSLLDLIVGFPGEGSEHFFEIFDPQTRLLKYQIMKHDTKILSICEMVLDKAHPTKDHYFVSSSIDKKVIMWPTAPMSTLVGQTQTKRLLRIADIIDYELRGHNHAIQSLAYAPQNEILFGCGFDFEVIAWDPFSRDVIMKFVGHFKSLSSVQIAYIPEEKLLSLDEAGVLKVWNISKDLGIYGNQESSVTLHCSQPAHVKDFVITHERGRGVAILAEKVFYMNVETDIIEELKPVHNGFGICPTAGRLFMIFRSTIHLYDVCHSKKFKKVAFLDPDRVSSTDEIVSNHEELRMDAPAKPAASATTPSQKTTAKSNSKEEDRGSLKYFNKVDIRDLITAVAMDGHGKKVFLGTREGRILMFDSYTFGLLKQLTTELEDVAFLYQGAVIGLSFVDRDELLVALYDNGAVKVYGGCLRAAAYTSPGLNEERSFQSPIQSSPKGLTRSGSTAQFSPIPEHFGSHQGGAGGFSFYGHPGGKAPPKPSLLRESDLGFIHDHSLRSLAVSVDHNLVATMTKSGLVFLYDYLTLDFLACLSMEDDTSNQNIPDNRPRNAHYLFIDFIPSVPVLIVVDNTHRIYAWGLKGMGNRFLISWNIYDDISYNNDKEIDLFYQNIDFQGAKPVSMGLPNFAAQNNPQVSYVKPYSFIAASDPVISTAATITAVPVNSRVSFSVPQGSIADFSQTRRKKSESEQRWMLIIATEDGLILTQNITCLIEKCGATNFLVKFDAHYPVYNKIKPKRYKATNFEPHHGEDFPRQKLPEEWENKIINPIKKITLAMDNTDVGGNMLDRTMSASGSVLIAPSTPSRVGSVSFSPAATNTSKTDEAIIESTAAQFSKPKLMKQGTNRKQMRNFQKMMKKMKLDDQVSTYVEGLFTWHAFSHHPVRVIQFYNPFLDYGTNEIQQLFGLHHHGNRVSNNLCYEVMTQHNRLPLLAMLGDNGNIRFWTFTGVYLGQNYEDTIGLETDQAANPNPIPYYATEDNLDPNKILDDLLEAEAQKKQASIFGEIFNLPDLKAASTFITKLEEPEAPYDEKKYSSHSKKPHNLRNEDDSLAPKIYVKSEKTSKIFTKRLSVVAKEYIPPTGPLKKPISFNENTILTNPKLTSSMIMQSFINYNNQITNDVNAYETYPIECMRLSRKPYGQHGWDFPHVQIALPLTLSKKDTEYFPIYESTVKFSYIQYKFYSKIIQQLLHYIQHDINALYLDKIGYFENPNLFASEEGKSNGSYNPRFVSNQAKLYRKISNYATRFQSTENLLKGIDTYLLKSTVQHQKNFQLLLNGKNQKGGDSTKGMTKTEDQMKKEMEKKKREIENLLLYSNMTTSNGVERSIYDLDYEEEKKNAQLLKYIISGLTDHEIMMANSLQKKTIDKQQKYNLTTLINYIQENEYFPADLKNQPSQALCFDNYEKEKTRKEQSASVLGSEEYFIKKLKEMDVDPDELKQLVKSEDLKKKKASTSKPVELDFTGPLSSSLSRPSSPKMINSGRSPALTTRYNPEDSLAADPAQIIQSSLQDALNDLHIPVDNSDVVNDTGDIVDIDKFIDEIKNDSPTQKSAPMVSGKPPRPNTAPATFNRDHSPPLSPQKRPISPSPTKVNRPNLSLVSPPSSPLRPSSPHPPQLASPTKGDGMGRPFSANDIFQHTSVPADQLDSPAFKRKLRVTKQLDQIIENLETISITGINAENSQSFPVISSMEEILEKSTKQYNQVNTRPLSASHESKPHLAMFIDTSPTLNVLDASSSTVVILNPLSTSSKGSKTPLQPEGLDQTNRIQEISQKYEDAILQSKIFSQSFHLYDPLNHKRNSDKEKHSKKLKRKLYLSRHRDQYLDEENQLNTNGGGQGMKHFIQKFYTEDILDMEKEYKNQEKKRLYIQATAAGEKTTYGLYRVADLFQFMAFTDLLTIVDMKDPTVHSAMNSDKSTKLFYFNENGQDFSKIVHNQPFYYIDEILIILLDFYNYEENILIKDLIFYRDESPRLPCISLYHLIEFFFSHSKSVSFHLRIFMFITGTSLIYDLFRNAMPPKEVLNSSTISKTKSKSFDLTEEEVAEQEEATQRLRRGSSSNTNQMFEG